MEEQNLIHEANEEVKASDEPKLNSVGRALKTIGVIAFMAGILIGGYFGKNPYNLINLWTAVPFWIGGTIIGLIFIGLGEIINLLQNISNKLDKNYTDKY